MVVCAACGERAPDGSRFCPKCGGALELGSVDPTHTSFQRVEPERAASTPFDEGRFLPGTVVAERYRIYGLLGRGGMGEVYRADDLKLGQSVALKFLPRDVERDGARRARFLDEVKIARQISHPNVCRVYDVGDVDGRHFLSMEYVDGEDLAGLLRRIGHLPKDKAVQIARQLCAGLAAAHEQGPCRVGFLDGFGGQGEDLALGGAHPARILAFQQIRLEELGGAGVADRLPEPLRQA